MIKITGNKTHNGTEFSMWRKELDIPLKTISELSGVWRNSLIHFEKGELDIQLSNFAKVIDVMGYQLTITKREELD